MPWRRSPGPLPGEELAFGAVGGGDGSPSRADSISGDAAHSAAAAAGAGTKATGSRQVAKRRIWVAPRIPEIY